MNNSVYNNKNKLLPISIMSTFLKGSIMIDSNKTNPNIDQQSSLSIYNAFTGVKIIAPFNMFNSMDSFKIYISQSLKIDVDRLFLLTPYGIKLKFSMIVHEQINEVFAFDRKFFNPALVKAEKTNLIMKELLTTIENDELITMIKPRESPLLVTNMESFINRMDSLMSSNNRMINSSDLDFDNLRLLLNLLRRNSGWASALLSDMKSTVFNNVYAHDYESIENILRALSSLIQYISILFTNLEKEFNAIVEIFANLNENSMNTKWKSSFKSLEKIYFSYKDKSTNKIRKLLLCDLIDIEKTRSSAIRSKNLSNEIQKHMVFLKVLIENDLVRQKKEIIDEYDSYKSLYLNPEWESLEHEIMEKSKGIFYKLETLIDNMSNEMDNLPSFEQLITTSNQMSTYLSNNATEKISRLIRLYDKHLNEYVPQITSFAEELYQIQRKSCDVREELQKKIFTSTLISVVQIQLSIREASKLFTTNIISNIELMQNEELQLSVVADLPLVFGIWVIAILGNIKYGMSINKLARKTCEVFDMINFIEQDNRVSWLKDFIDGVGVEKVDVLRLNNLDYKNKFIFNDLFTFEVVPKVKKQPQIDSTNTTNRQNSEFNTYLTPFNKFIQNINGFPVINKQELKSHQKTIALSDNDLIKLSNKSFFEGLISFVTLNDILQYMDCIKSINYDPELLSQLHTYLKNVGINESAKINDPSSKAISVKVEKFDDLGTFDSQDPHHMKIFRKFIKGFEGNGITIDVAIENQSKGKSSADIGIVRHYEERIKKLENLLHEKKFHSFNDRWSQVNPETFKVVEEENVIENQIDVNSPGILGRRTLTLPPSHYSERIKQLENENHNLHKEVDELKKSQTGQEISKMKGIIETQDNKMKNLQLKFEDSNKIIKEKDLKIEKMFQEMELIKKENLVLKEKNNKLNYDVNELKHMNEDLLDNMSHKENELINENQINQKEKNDLNLRIEELLEIKHHYDCIVDKIKITKEMMNHVLSILFFSFEKLRDLSNNMFTNMSTFCLVLEIMGLLLVKEENDARYDIKRVKGLRYKKREIYAEKNGIVTDNENLEHKRENGDKKEFGSDEDKLLLEVVASQVIIGSKSKLEWIPNMKSDNANHNEVIDFIGQIHDSDNMDETKVQSTKIKEIDDILESLTSYNYKLQHIGDTYSESILETKYNDFIQTTNIRQDLLLERVHKRFEDVESLARKLQREKNQCKNEAKSLSKKLSQQLVLRNFQKGDLVLFLRTLVPFDNNSNSNVSLQNMKKQPWAIFNIGSPNYYLKHTQRKESEKLDEKEWFVGRIKGIEKHVINMQNKDSVDENPFNLGIGTAWYYVETKEESI